MSAWSDFLDNLKGVAVTTGQVALGGALDAGVKATIQTGRDVAASPGNGNVGAVLGEGQRLIDKFGAANETGETPGEASAHPTVVGQLSGFLDSLTGGINVAKYAMITAAGFLVWYMFFRQQKGRK